MSRTLHRRISRVPVVLLAVAVALGCWILFRRESSVARASAAVGQSTATSQPPGLIDGSKNPELIPDSTAYRLFLLTVAVPLDASPAELKRQYALLRWSGLDENDIQPAVEILSEFRSQYDQLVKQYNESAAEADKAGGAPDLQTFLYQRDALVKYMCERLKLNLTATGMARLDAHVQQEKRGMKVAKEVQ